MNGDTPEKGMNRSQMIQGDVAPIDKDHGKTSRHMQNMHLESLISPLSRRSKTNERFNE